MLSGEVRDPTPVFTGSLRAHVRNRLGGRGREQGELSRKEVMEVGPGGAVASMHSGQILDLFRGWNQRDLLIDKVWGERAGAGFSCPQTYILVERTETERHPHTKRRQRLEETDSGMRGKTDRQRQTDGRRRQTLGRDARRGPDLLPPTPRLARWAPFPHR